MSNSKISVNIGDLFIDEYNSAYIVINKYYEAINNDKVSSEIVGFVRFYDIKKGITIEHPENLILELTNIYQIHNICMSKQKITKSKRIEKYDIRKLKTGDLIDNIYKLRQQNE